MSATIRNPEKYDPDLWTDEYAFLNKPGEADIQSDLFYDYRTNVDAYPKWQAWMQKTQPRLLVLWGKYDLSFELTEPEAYRRDVPKAEVHVLDAGHFALDTAADRDCAARPGLHEVAAGADVNTGSKDGKTARSIARERGYTQIMQLLGAAGAAR